MVNININNFPKWTSTLAMRSNGPLPQVYCDRTGLQVYHIFYILPAIPFHIFTVTFVKFANWTSNLKFWQAWLWLCTLTAVLQCKFHYTPFHVMQRMHDQLMVKSHATILIQKHVILGGIHYIGVNGT